MGDLIFRSSRGLGWAWLQGAELTELGWKGLGLEEVWLEGEKGLAAKCLRGRVGGWSCWRAAGGGGFGWRVGSEG